MFRFVLASGMLFLIILIRAIEPAPIGRRQAVLFATPFALASLWPLGATVLGGTFVAPDLPGWAIFSGSFLAAWGVVAALAVLLRDAIGLLWRIVTGRFPGLSHCLWIFYGIIFGSFAWTAVGTAITFELPQVRRVELRLDRLPEQFDGLRIVQLSDLHVCPVFTQTRTQGIVDRVNAEHPDLVVLTGDFADGRAADRGRYLEPVSGIRAPLGIWGCEGNHEHYVDYEGWMRLLPQLGISMLRNEHALIERNGARVVLAGTTDFMAERYGREMPNLSKALAGAPDALTVLLSHQPKAAPLIVGRGVDLVLSGHTHGGQTPITSLAVWMLNGGLVRGLYRVGTEPEALWLYINSGTTLWSGFPVRIGTRGEITVLTLRSGAKVARDGADGSAAAR